MVRKEGDKIVKIFTIQDRKLDGKFIEYVDGRLWKTFYYVNDTLNGIYTQYSLINPDIVEMTGNYYKGQPIGIFKGFYNSGNVCCWLYFKKGKIKKVKYYDENGQAINFEKFEEIRGRDWVIGTPKLMNFDFEHRSYKAY